MQGSRWGGKIVHGNDGSEGKESAAYKGLLIAPRNDADPFCLRFSESFGIPKTCVILGSFETGLKLAMEINTAKNDELNDKKSSGQSLRICMDIDIVLEVVASSYHLASLRQLYVYCSTNLASYYLVEVFALPGVH